MKIQIASDLHLEGYVPWRLTRHRTGSAHTDTVRVRESYGRVYPPPSAFQSSPSRDVLVLAGDIGTGTLAQDFVLAELQTSPVIYVPGNHEYYGYRQRAEINDAWRELAAQHAGLHFLLGDMVVIGDVRFWGAPWYSDLWGTYPELVRNDPWKARMLERQILDFRSPHNAGTWTLARHVQAHHEETAVLRQHAGAVDVVVTHWPPTKEAIHPRFDGDEQSPYFINDHEELVREVGAKLWISGHTHEPYDYQIGGTRCLGNPTGYGGEERVAQSFRPDRVVQVDASGRPPEAAGAP